MSHIARAFLIFVAAIVLVAGCAPLAQRTGTARYEKTTYADLPGWDAAALAPSLRAFLAGCPRLQAIAALERACAAAQEVSPDDAAAARKFFETTFVPYAVIAPDGSDAGLVTGYYEPVLEGSRERTDRFRYPVYGVPDDLVDVDLASLYPELKGMRLRGRLEGRKLVPYYSRSEIDADDDGFKGPVIAWVADPVELFFLQIQGSGQIRFGDDDRIRVGYADQNGHPYRSLGRYLVAQGELPLEQASMQGIKAWAQAHPESLPQALEQNPSYVFFRDLPASGGPIGALGAPLSAMYSIAVDRRYYSLGAPVYLASTLPLSNIPLEQLVIAQDTGGAIRGAVRADFFWGSGDEAGDFAGRMRQQGRMWLLWPRGEPLPPL
jgi:membrane-bound lytic murein transglycosylase A